MKKSESNPETAVRKKTHGKSSNSLGVKRDLLIVSCIKNEIFTFEGDLLPKVVLTEDELHKTKEKLKEKLFSMEEMLEQPRGKVSRRLSELMRPLEVYINSKKVDVRDLPKKYQMKSRIYILVPGVKPLLFLEKLKREYYIKHDGQAEMARKILYAYALSVAEEKIRRKRKL